MFSATVGRGILVATSLDHTEESGPAGRHLLQLTLEWLADNSSTSPATLDPTLVRQWAIP